LTNEIRARLVFDVRWQLGFCAPASFRLNKSFARKSLAFTAPGETPSEQAVSSKLRSLRLPTLTATLILFGSASTAAYSSFFSSSRATICSGFGSGQFASSYSLPVSGSRYLSQYFLRVRSLIRLQLIVIRVTQVRNVDLPSNILSLTKAFSRESWTASSASALFPRILVATLSRRSLDHSASSPNARPSPLLASLTRFDSVTVCPGRTLMNRSGATATSTARRLFPSPMTACGVERELDIETRAAMAAALPARNSVALRFPG